MKDLKGTSVRSLVRLINKADVCTDHTCSGRVSADYICTGHVYAGHICSGYIGFLHVFGTYTSVAGTHENHPWVDLPDRLSS